MSSSRSETWAALVLSQAAHPSGHGLLGGTEMSSRILATVMPGVAESHLGSSLAGVVVIAGLAVDGGHVGCVAVGRVGAAEDLQLLTLATSPQPTVLENGATVKAQEVGPAKLTRHEARGLAWPVLEFPEQPDVRRVPGLQPPAVGADMALRPELVVTARPPHGLLRNNHLEPAGTTVR